MPLAYPQMKLMKRSLHRQEEATETKTNRHAEALTKATPNHQPGQAIAMKRIRNDPAEAVAMVLPSLVLILRMAVTIPSLKVQ